MLRFVILSLALLLGPIAAAQTAPGLQAEGPAKAQAGVPTARGLAPDRAYLTFGSQHLNVDPADFGLVRWNEVNPGLILTWEDRGPWGLNYSLGAFQNSFADLSLYAATSRTWAIGTAGWRLGWVLGLANYGDNARFVRSQIGQSGWIVTGGAQIEFRNFFVQIQPAGTQRGGGQGAILVTGISFALGK